MQIEPIELAKIAGILLAFSQNTFQQDTIQTSNLSISKVET